MHPVARDYRLFVCMFVCMFVCLFACLLVCLIVLFRPQMRPVARESWSGKLLGEAGWATGSQVQTGRSTQIQIKIQIQWLTIVSFQDNEFDLVFVLGYQKMLALAYLDKVKKMQSKF